MASFSPLSLLLPPNRFRAGFAALALALSACSSLAFAADSVEVIQNDGTVAQAPRGPIELPPGEKKQSLLDFPEDPADRPSAMDDSFYLSLNPLLATQDYKRITDAIIKAKAQTDPKTLRWYEAAARAGHIRLMWELADSLARAGRLEKATYWSYAALIGTYQETALCTMNETKFAADSLIRSHTASRDAAHQNGQISRDALRFAFQLNAQLPSISPEWLCRGYAQDPRARRAFYYDPPYWPDLRFQARERLARQLLNPPNGWTPGLAEAVAKGQFSPALWSRAQ